MKRKNLTGCLTAGFLFLFTACQGADEGPQVFEISQTALQQDIQQPGQSIYIPVNTNIDDAKWDMRSDADWCTVVKNRQNDKPVIYMEVRANTGLYVRTATVSVHSPVNNYEINVRQLGYESAILVNSQVFSFDAAGGNLKLTVTANVDVDITTPDWITEVTGSDSRAIEVVSRNYNYLVRGNSADESRQVNLEVRERMPAGISDEPKIVLVSVNQKGLGAYEAGEIGDQLKDDIKLSIASGTASSQQNNTDQSINMSFDGNTVTHYHSRWSEPYRFPFTLTYILANTADVDYFIYYPRTDNGGVNGNFGEIDVLYSATENGPYTTIGTYDFGEISSPSMIVFDQPVYAKSFRFIVKSGKEGFASCGEMEFYARNAESFDHSTLFTDETCSELKPGITEAQIDACPYPLFKNIAYYMYKNKYPREFRIADFKAWPNPDIQATLNCTASYSLLDNPTGIVVRKDETLVVMVGDSHGYPISLKLHSFQPPAGNQDNYDGYYYYTSYPLKRGVNKLTMKDNGLLYVMYHTLTLAAAETQPPIKIHFATGTVNGYFDTQNPTHTGRWTELLNKATNSHFDLLGKDVHMTFETNAFKQYTGTRGLELANLLDNVVQSEQRLLGFDKYTERRFRNRMYMNVIYRTPTDGVYAYAISYHTGYRKESQSSILNPSVFPADCWGTAHEIGHMNQVRPGIDWPGMTEVTNNIMSMYIQTTTLKQTSRLQSENRYNDAWQKIFIGEKAFCEHLDSNDVFSQLVMFWQLELYFGEVLGQTPLQQADGGGFYPEVYEYARNKNYTGMSNGDIQLDFVYNCCLASKKNLLDFFERWGFLKPVEGVVISRDNSGNPKEIMTITESMVNGLRNKVNALGYPTPSAALEYITDNTVALFKQNSPVTQGTVQKSGSTATLSGWSNVAIFEVKDASGKLLSIAVGTTSSFNLPAGATLYAVAFNGQRIQVASNN
ncbi:MAG: M60 family metallopeptidase [Mediterranea sp.]|jgi:hypothetical protein|nr:M60 family metallopeptidase [Mediterranea sp.]